MSAKGRYELELTCDERVNGGTCQRNIGVTDDTRAGAKELARRQGWLLQRDGKTYCPAHAEERRRK